MIFQGDYADDFQMIQVLPRIYINTDLTSSFVKLPVRVYHFHKWAITDPKSFVDCKISMKIVQKEKAQNNP